MVRFLATAHIWFSRTAHLAWVVVLGIYLYEPSYASGLVSVTVSDHHILLITVKKRLAPAPLSISSNGIRYEAIHWGKSRGLSQNGGYIAAIDRASGRELWVLKVYDVGSGTDLEGDKQDVFITKMSLVLDGLALEIINERGARFRIDLVGRKVAPR